MYTKILVIGQSGSGKSTSLRNFNKGEVKDTFLINVLGKPLPFKGAKKQFPTVRDVENKEDVRQVITRSKDEIIKILKWCNSIETIKNIVIDDFVYITSLDMLSRSDEKGFDKFADFAKNMIEPLMLELRKDITLIVMTHPDFDIIDGKRFIKPKTLSKFVDEKVVFEGMFTFVFESMVKDDGNGIKYMFLTNSPNEWHIAKTPMGYFEELYIDNDLSNIVEYIRKEN